VTVSPRPFRPAWPSGPYNPATCPSLSVPVSATFRRRSKGRSAS